jgi:hypothetical protein
MFQVQEIALKIFKALQIACVWFELMTLDYKAERGTGLQQVQAGGGCDRKEDDRNVSC